MEEEPIGAVTHFFRKPMVAVVRIDAGALAVGDALHFRGRTTDLFRRVDSMEIDGQPVPRAGGGDLVGVRVPERVRRNDVVFKVRE